MEAQSFTSLRFTSRTFFRFPCVFIQVCPTRTSQTTQEPGPNFLISETLWTLHKVCAASLPTSSEANHTALHQDSTALSPIRPTANLFRPDWTPPTHLVTPNFTRPARSPAQPQPGPSPSPTLPVLHSTPPQPYPTPTPTPPQAPPLAQAPPRPHSQSHPTPVPTQSSLCPTTPLPTLPSPHPPAPSSPCPYSHSSPTPAPTPPTALCSLCHHYPHNTLLPGPAWSQSASCPAPALASWMTAWPSLHTETPCDCCLQHLAPRLPHGSRINIRQDEPSSTQSTTQVRRVQLWRNEHQGLNHTRVQPTATGIDSKEQLATELAELWWYEVHLKSIRNGDQMNWKSSSKFPETIVVVELLPSYNMQL